MYGSDPPGVRTRPYNTCSIEFHKVLIDEAEGKLATANVLRCSLGTRWSSQVTLAMLCSLRHCSIETNVKYHILQKEPDEWGGSRNSNVVVQMVRSTVGSAACSKLTAGNRPSEQQHRRPPHA